MFHSPGNLDLNKGSLNQIGGPFSCFGWEQTIDDLTGELVGHRSAFLLACKKTKKKIECSSNLSEGERG